MKTSDKNLVGAAGENLVLSRLLSRGILASQAPRGTRKADVLVNPLDGSSPLLIQVKTTLKIGGRTKWHMKEKHEVIADEDMFYCFVELGEIDSSVYVVPAKKVARVVSDSHRAWLREPGKNGQAHNDTVMRWITNEYPRDVKGAKPGWMDEYLENWELIS